MISARRVPSGDETLCSTVLAENRETNPTSPISSTSKTEMISTRILPIFGLPYTTVIDALHSTQIKSAIAVHALFCGWSEDVRKNEVYASASSKDNGIRKTHSTPSDSSFLKSRRNSTTADMTAKSHA